jgi:small subunit ribosomal protein S7
MRKSQAKKLPLAPDAKYNDILVTRFVNNLMWQGKKNTAFGLFYDAIDRVSKQSNDNGYEIWRRALNNVTPAVEVRSRRIGGATFQIPAEVRADRKISLSIKWLIRFSRERNGKSMAAGRWSGEGSHEAHPGDWWQRLFGTICYRGSQGPLYRAGDLPQPDSSA